MSPSNNEASAPEGATPAAGLPEQGGPLMELAATAPEIRRIHIPVNARGTALAVLATIAFVFALQWAQKFFIPLVFGILITYTLTPVVVCLERLRIPRFAATTLVLLTLLGGAAAVTNSLGTEFQSIVERLPDAARRISRAITKTEAGQKP